jgi:membrane-bound serine protease (ClpP class)
LTTADQPEYEVDRRLLIATGVVAASIVIVVGTAIVRTRRLPSHTGAAALVGQTATARSYLNPDGFVFLRGERWKAVAENAPVSEGDVVEVTAVEGLTLTVRRVQESSGQPS